MDYNELLVNPLPRVETKTLHGLTGCWDVLIRLAKFAGGAVFYSVWKTRKKFHEKSVEISVAVFDEKTKKYGASWGQTLGERDKSQTCLNTWIEHWCRHDTIGYRNSASLLNSASLCSIYSEGHPLARATAKSSLWRLCIAMMVHFLSPTRIINAW